MRRVLCGVALAITLVWPPASVRAGQPGGVVTGSVTDANGLPLEGATVAARSRTTGRTRSATTEADGRYVLVALPGDEYDLSAARTGFAEAARPGVRLDENGVLGVDFTLQAVFEQTVDVSAAAAVRDRTRSVAQQTVGEPFVHDLPLFGRRYLELASLAPGFTGNPNFPSPHGQIYWSNNVIVDGASHFSAWRSAARAFYSGYPLESIKEVQVLTNHYSAEFGEALATVTSAVTRSGTNTWRGSGFLFLQNGAWDGRPPFGTSRPKGDGQQFGGTIGGPLVVDRSHLFAAYEGRRSRRRNVVTSPAAAGLFVPDDQDEHLALLKVDAQATARHFLTARYSAQRFRWHDEPGGLTLPGSGMAFRNDTQTVLATDVHELSRRLVGRIRFQFARYVDMRRDLSPTPYVVRAGYSLEGGALGPLGIGAEPEDTWEAADTLTYWTGSHVVKFGGGLRHVRVQSTALAYGWGAYFFAGAPAAFPQPYFFAQGVAPSKAAATLDARSLSAFGFVEDNWKLSTRLTVDLGARYDIQRISHVVGFDARTDRTNIQPRIGVAWSPTRTSLVIRGGLGVYTQQQLLYHVGRVQLEGVGGIAPIGIATSSPLAPQFPAVFDQFRLPAVLPPRDLVRVDQSFRNPYSLQATAGIEGQTGATTLSADYLWLEGRDLMSLIDANAPSSIEKPLQRSVAAADLLRPSVPEPNTFRKILTLGNQGRSWYRALQLRADRTDGPVRAIASYTLGRATDMANYLLPEDSRNVAAEKGPADADVRHNLTAGLTWSLPGRGRLAGGWVVSALGGFRSARPYTISWGDDRNGTTQNDARPGGRNTARGGAYRNVDVALMKRFTWKGAALEGRVEAFNLFNATNYDQYVGALLSPLYGRPVTAFPPRRLQAAASISF